MRYRRGTIKPRHPIFLGCEGLSEQGYGALLAQYVRSLTNVHVHIYSVVLNPGAGDPLALVEKAIQRISQDERNKARYRIKAILLDRDKMGRAPDRDRHVEPLARSNGIHLIWQTPKHEGFLLRHLDGCLHLRPDSNQCDVRLRQEWPQYRKPMSKAALADRISADCISRAAGVEPDLRVFLEQIGWL